MNISNKLLTLFLVIYAPFLLAQEPKGVSSVTVQELKDMISLNDKNNVVLDVRTEGEFSGGYIESAKNYNFLSPTFEKEIADFDKSKTYYVYCFSGGRSLQAVQKMNSLGFKAVDVEGGIRAWTKAGNPLAR